LSIFDLDIIVLDWLNSHHIPGTTGLLQLISAYTTWVNIGTILVVLLLAWRQKSRELLYHFFLLAVIMIVGALVISTFKELVDRERPFYTYPFIEKLARGGGSSFPSGHTVESFAVATGLSLLFRRRSILIAGYGWAILVAYTRMALGVHYPTDVVAGALTGILLGYLIYCAYRWSGLSARFPKPGSYPDKNPGETDR
jgi:undecaprenyl-diphosphatase